MRLLRPVLIQTTQICAFSSHHRLFCLLGKQYCRRTTFRRLSSLPEMAPSKELEAKLINQTTEFKLRSGETVTVDSVIQDTMPSGSSVGTVVALHGAPGSHKDFKYITPLLHVKGIRTIGINFPDYGHTSGHEKLQYDNEERNNYVKAVIEKAGLKENVVMMGHSRGCENATGTAAQITDILCGLVLLCPTGLRLHRGLRPFWVIRFLIWLYDLGPIAKMVMDPMMLFFYNNLIGLRLDSGERAMMCVRTMYNIELDGLKSKIQTINDAEKVRVLMALAGKDLFIEEPVSMELAAAWNDHQLLRCSDQSSESNDAVIQQTEQLYANGTKSVSVFFEKEGHFLQKHRAHFIADSIEAILKKA